MTFAGCIRGAIAFGLSISIETTNKTNDKILMSTTLILVFFTTIVFGALMPIVIKILKKYDIGSPTKKANKEPANQESVELYDSVYSFSHPNNKILE
jgi:NhaP-type Na+/H+ or K+/H+ antiporter